MVGFVCLRNHPDMKFEPTYKDTGADTNLIIVRFIFMI